MKQSNNELLRKFDTMARWMIEDTERAMFDAKANFLVAQGLVNYSEVIGSFILPGGNSGERFDTFLARMGETYERLLHRFNNKRRTNPHVVYDDLRCGLTHEYTIKRKKFIIYNYDGRGHLSDTEINNLSINISGVDIPSSTGIMHTWEGKRGVWHFIDPKYWLDFKNALEQYKNEINNPRNRELRRNFFLRARKINFLKFGV